MQQESRDPRNAPPNNLRKKKTYDKDLINESLYEVLAYYAPGEARTIGSRTTYTCPECRKAKLDASGAHMRAGCWNAECPVPQFADALGLIAHFESLEPSRQFREILEKGYEIVGLDLDSRPERPSASSGSSDKPSSSPQASAATPAWATPDGRAASPSSLVRKPVGRVPSQQREEAPEGRPPEERSRLRAAVYGRVMDYCKLEERDRRFFRGRGLTDGSIEKGGFGSISFARAQALKETLLDEFGPEDLLLVPGFSAKDTGGLRFTLTGDYALIPYHDRSGRTATIEGRWTGSGPPPPQMGKYVTLSGAGNHLYVFPGHSFDGIEAFCEGPVGAMVAAQSGITVGAVQGFRRYRASSGSACDGEYGGPLQELGGVDFGGRTVPYIPDVDDPPQPEVSEAAPEAARWLVERQGGRAALLRLPEGKDLDEWLLRHEPQERRSRFEELLAGAEPLPSVRGASEESVNTAVADTRPSSGGEPGGEPQSDTASDNSAEVVEGSDEREKSEDRCLVGADLDDGELRDRVYRAFVEAFPLSDDHRKLLMQWKVSKETAMEAGLSSFPPADAERLRSELLETFERSALERVAGFVDSGGALRLPFEDLGEKLIVFPYKDAAGRTTALEGVRLSRGLAGEERYVSPEGEARLYLPPGIQAEGMELLCGGVLSALNLAEAGIRAAALRGLESSRAGGEMSVREAPSLHLGGRPVGVFEGRDDSARLRAAVESLGGYPVAVELPEQVESVERWIISLPGNKERGQILSRLVEAVRSAPTRPVESSNPEAREAGEKRQAGEAPPNTDTHGLRQGSLFDGDPAQDERKRSQSAEDPEGGQNRSADDSGSDAGTTDDQQGSVSNGGDSNGGDSNGGEAAANEEEMRRIESLPALHGEGWLEVRFEDIPKIVARDRPRVREEEDEGGGGGLEEAGQFAGNPRRQAPWIPSCPRPAKHDLQLGASVGAMCAAAGAMACVLMLYALNWPLGLVGSALTTLCCGVAAGLLFGVGATLRSCEGRSKSRRPGSAANSSAYSVHNTASDAWSRSWSQAAFAFGATYLVLTLCHHVAHLLVYPLAGSIGRGPEAGLLASVAVSIGDILDGVVPEPAVRIAALVGLAASIAVFARVWEVRKNGPGETVVEVAGGSYTLPSQSHVTFWEGVAAVVVFAVVARLSCILFEAFAGSFDGGIGGDAVQSLADGKLVLVSCLAGLGAAAYGWLGSKARRRVEREHRLGALREH